MNQPPINRQRGFTLVEAGVTLAVATLLVGAVAPSFQRSIERRHVEGIAAQLETDLQLARSLAVARNEGVRVSFEASGDASCYIVHSGAAGDCSCIAAGPAVCRAGGVALHTVQLQAGAGVQIRSNSRSILVDAQKGTITPTATLQVNGRSGLALNQIINIMGRVRTCSPGGTLPGYRRC